MQSKIHGYDLNQFSINLSQHQDQIDDVLYDIVMSCIEQTAFKGLL